MFLDKVKIECRAGNGGNGVVSFRREKFVPNGGPNGGDGGKGGDIIFKVSKNIDNLGDFRYKKKFKAEDGSNGSANNKFGKDGKFAKSNSKPYQTKNTKQFGAKKSNKVGKGNYR